VSAAATTVIVATPRHHRAVGGVVVRVARRERGRVVEEVSDAADGDGLLCSQAIGVLGGSFKCTCPTGRGPGFKTRIPHLSTSMVCLSQG